MAIAILTTSSATPEDYLLHKDTAIYPAFLDGLPYESWGPEATIADSKKSYFQFRASGATNIQWTYAGDLPPGLVLESNGQLKGTPLQEGVFDFTIIASSGNESGNALLSMKVYPERSRWLRDARFGVTVHWGRFSYPPIQNSPYYQPPNDGTGTEAFQARAASMNAEAWANQFEEWRAGFIEFSGIWQDSYRNWPSTADTRFQLHSCRDFVGEITGAFHAKGMKAISYFCPDYVNLDPPQYASDADGTTHAWGGMNNALVKELVLKGLDGLWVDIGGASSVYDEDTNPPVNWRWFYWDSLMPIMRYNNPFFIFGVNAGTSAGGTKVEYPYADFVIYESRAGVQTTSATLLELAVPVLSKKRMAVYVSNLLSKHFAWGEFAYQDPIKDIAGTKENLRLNWEAGATVSIALPVQPNGTLVHPHYEAAMTAIGEYVKLNKNFGIDPTITYSNGLATVSTPSPARVLYTLDGTEPNTASNIIFDPLPITRNARLKVRTLQQDKAIGYVKDLYVEAFDATQPAFKLFHENGSGVLKTQSKSYFRGMRITIGNAPIILKSIGRQTTPVSHPRDIVIRRYFDQFPVYSGTMSGNEPIDGNFQFKDIAEVRLERGMTYVICVQEDAGAGYNSNDFATLPFTQDIRIVGPAGLSVLGDFFPAPVHAPVPNGTPVDDLGQLLNLKYEVVQSERVYDLARGKPAEFFDNTNGVVLTPAAEKYFAINATDGNPNSVARAGGSWPYTLRVDLMVPSLVDRITLNFTEENFATEFQVFASLNATGGPNELIASLIDNMAKSFEFKFNSILARYIFIRATQPSQSGQTGSQMAVSEVGVFFDKGTN